MVIKKCIDTKCFGFLLCKELFGRKQTAGRVKGHRAHLKIFLALDWKSVDIYIQWKESWALLRARLLLWGIVAIVNHDSDDVGSGIPSPLTYIIYDLP